MIIYSNSLRIGKKCQGSKLPKQSGQIRPL